jgi:hypothetical protein
MKHFSTEKVQSAVNMLRLCSVPLREVGGKYFYLLLLRQRLNSLHKDPLESRAIWMEPGSALFIGHCKSTPDRTMHRSASFVKADLYEYISKASK